MKINIITLGCKTNQSESEAIGVALANAGFDVGFEISPADIYVLNTCSITAEADKKSRQLVARVRASNPNADIFVCGCSSQNNPEPFIKKENVKLVLGTDKLKIVDEILSRYAFNAEPKETHLRTRRYLKIQDGCNNFCTYCIVPYLRGREKSYEISDIVSKAEELSSTCKEIVITGINMSSFGRDNNTSLTELMLALKNVNARIRIGSLEPRVITPEFLQALAGLKNFCPHFHLSMQSGSDNVLKIMNRHYKSSEFIEKTKLIRSYFPDAFIACDVIVGFPTETEENFNETTETVKAVKYSFMHIFPYSRREGTVAAKMKQISPDVMKKRVKIMQDLNSKFKIDYIKEMLNKEESVLIEENKQGVAEGYGKHYIKCYIKDANLNEADIIKVKMVEPYLDGVLCEKI